MLSTVPSDPIQKLHIALSCLLVSFSLSLSSFDLHSFKGQQLALLWNVPSLACLILPHHSIQVKYFWQECHWNVVPQFTWPTWYYWRFVLFQNFLYVIINIMILTHLCSQIFAHILTFSLGYISGIVTAMTKGCVCFSNFCYVLPNCLPEGLCQFTLPPQWV